MAADWIKMRRGLRHDPKVIAIARFLSGRRDFMDWWTGPQQMTCDDNVTEVVTLRNVTRVTVCALLDVWASLNNSLSGDGLAPFMEISDIDDIAEIPGFGEAMESVGWVKRNSSQGVHFPNFMEHNTPTRARGKSMSNAERQRAYRERKKAQQAQAEEAEKALRYVTGEKRREEVHNTPSHARARGGRADGLEPKISRILSAFNIGTDPAMIGRTAMDEFLSQPQFLEDAAIEVIRQKAPAWMDQDWIRDVSPRLVAKHLAEIYNYQPKTEVTSNAADKYENGF